MNDDWCALSFRTAAALNILLFFLLRADKKQTFSVFKWQMDQGTKYLLP